MVVKTELCAFSETRIYPGKGSRFVTRGGQLIIFSSSKVDSLYHQRKKPAKLVWTQAWRRMHKKLNVEATQKRKTRRVVKLSNRGFVGMDMQKLKETRRPAGAAVVKKEAGAAKVVVKQATIKEAKEKAKLAAVEKKKSAPKGAAPKAAAPAKSHVAGKGR